MLISTLSLDQKVTVKVLEALKPASLLVIEDTHNYSAFLVVSIQDVNCSVVTKIGYGIIVCSRLVQLEDFSLRLGTELQVLAIHLADVFLSRFLRLFADVSSHYKFIMI